MTIVAFLSSCLSAYSVAIQASIIVAYVELAILKGWAAIIPVGARMMSLCDGFVRFTFVSACAHASASFIPTCERSSDPFPLPPVLWQLRQVFA